jgi:hypothetical protein
MIATIGNPELEFLFEETSFRKGKKSQAELELLKIYESTFVEMPTVGQVISAELTGITNNTYNLTVSGYKDDVNGYQTEIDEFGKCFGTADFNEGTAAFIEKRKPEFK